MTNLHDITGVVIGRNEGQRLGRCLAVILRRTAMILAPTDANLDLAATSIASGNLVAIPTETVYGLGADATNEKALLEIYRVKKRPLTDPIIVHVLDF